MAGLPSVPGYTGGQLATQLDLQAIQDNKIKLQDDRVGLMRDQIGLVQEMNLMRLMKGLKPGQANSPDGMANILDQMSLVEIESGMIDKGAATAQKASQIREQASTVRFRQFRMRQQRLQQFANVLDSVPDTAQGYQTALLTIAQSDPNAVRDPQFAALMQTPWRPGLVAQIKSQVTNAKDKSLIKYRDQQIKKSNEDIKVDEARIALMNREKQYLNDRDKKLAKEGATPVKSGQLQAITDQATRDFPGADPADIRVRSRPLAEEMVQVMQKQHLTASEAAVQVYQRAKKNGVFNGLRKMPTLKGTSAKNPLPLPYTDSEQAKADGYKRISDNQWYMVNGVPMLALGGSFYSQQELDQADSENAELDDQLSQDDSPQDNE